MLDNAPMDEKTNKLRLVIGWFAVTISTCFTSFWAFWGIIENFHEGWYQPSLLDRLAMMFAQYLSFMIAFLVAGIVSIRWRWLGSILHLSVAGFCIYFFAGSSAASRLVVPPMLLLAIAYWSGRIEPRKLAYRIAIGIPLIVLVLCGIEPTYRAATRIDDGDRGARRLSANGVDLIWAPEGPGWPDHGKNWEHSVRQCALLMEDGLTLADEPQNIWRLPTVEEVVRSQCRHGENSGGRWDAEAGRATYETWPDKETPLWNPTSKVIYWWTATETSETEVLTVSYRGHANPRLKSGSYGYQAFRAVRTPPAE